MRGTGDNRRYTAQNYDRWPELKAIYKKINEIKPEDDKTQKKLKKKALNDCKSTRYLAAVMVLTTIIFAVSAITIMVTKKWNTFEFNILKYTFIISAVFLAVFAVIAWIKGNKNVNMVTGKTGMDNLTLYKQKCWVEALTELADRHGISKEYAFMDIIAYQDVKSVYYKYIKLIQYLLLISFLCFIPGIDPPNGGIINFFDAVKILVSIVYVVIVNVVADFVNSMLGELGSLNYLHSDMVYALLEHFKELDNQKDGFAS
jgi:hypothetical protein